MSTPATPPVCVRVTPNERAKLEAAAAHARTNLSDFVRRTALEAAEIELRARPVAIISATDWDRFEAWVHAPAKPVPALRELAAIKPVWQAGLTPSRPLTGDDDSHSLGLERNGFAVP